MWVPPVTPAFLVPQEWETVLDSGVLSFFPVPIFDDVPTIPIS